MAEQYTQPPRSNSHAYRNAILISVASGFLFFLIFGMLPGLVFGFLHFLGNLKSIQSSPIDSIPAMQIRKVEKTIESTIDHEMESELSDGKDSGINEDCSSISTSTPKRGRSSMKRMLKSLKLKRISAIITSPKND